MRSIRRLFSALPSPPPSTPSIPSPPTAAEAAQEWRPLSPPSTPSNPTAPVPVEAAQEWRPLSPPSTPSNPTAPVPTEAAQEWRPSPPPSTPSNPTAPVPPAAAQEWRPLYRRLSALFGSVVDVMNQWVVVERRNVNAAHLMGHVRELRKHARFAHALEMIDWMETSGLQMPNGSHAVKLDLISKVRGINSAEEYFSKLPGRARFFGAYDALLSCYCKEKMVDKAIAIYEMMKQRNIAFKTLTYNNLMSLYLNLGQMDKVLALYAEMKERNIYQSNCTYRIVMNCYSSMNDMDSVEKLVHEMIAKQGSLDWFTYCSLAAVYNSAGLFDKAVTSLQSAELVMDARDLSPFRYLISLYAGAGKLEEVKRVWDLLKARVPKTHNPHPRPTNMNYIVMLQALMKLDDIDTLKQCFEEWEAACMNYDIKLVNSVIAAYLRKDMLEEAELLQEKAAKKGAQSDLKTFALFTDYYLITGDLELASRCSVAATSLVKRGRIIAIPGASKSSVLEEVSI